MIDPRLKPLRHFRYLSLGIPVAMAAHAAAAEPAASFGPARELAPMVVTETASRVTENVADVPQTVVIVEPESIGRRQPTTPIEMLREQPGIWAADVVM